jgi:PAS domain S-box-containing protein
VWLFPACWQAVGSYSKRLRKVRHQRHASSERRSGAQQARVGEQDVLQAALLHAEAESVAGFGSWRWDLDTNAMRWSDGLYRLFGLEPGAVEPSFEAFARLVHPDDRDRVAESGRRALEERVTSTDEFRIIRPDGEERTVLGVGKPVLDGDQTTIAILGTTQDITARREADAELRASEARYRALMEHAPEAIVVLDVDRGCFHHVNENATKLFKLSRERLLASGPAELSPPVQPDGRSSAEAAREFINQAIAGATPVFEWVHRAADGTDVTCEVRLVRLPDNERILVRGSVTDITDRKRAERELALAAVERKVAARARDLQQVTEAALAHLRLDDLLPELARRLCDILGVDNAAVLLANERGDLTVRAAHGIEQVAIGVTIPAGKGFAGRVMAERRPLALYGEEPRRIVINPVLRDVRALLGIPLIVKGRGRGVLHVGSLKDRRFSEEEVSLIALAADRAALGIEHARIYERERSIAETLQRSLLPDRLPDIPGFDLAASYQAAGEGYDVGGDFYDAFAVDDGRWLVVIGDVCGKGPEAAALTALTRYTLRAEATHEPRPAALLTLLNRAILQQRSDQRFCTAACALIERQDTGAAVTVSVGGHPLPLIVRADGRVEPVGRAGTPIGMVDDPSLSEETTSLGPGDTIVFYTDGLLDAHAPRRMLGEDDVAEVVGASAGLPPSTLVSRLHREATRLSDTPARDDVAIVALRKLTP